MLIPPTKKTTPKLWKNLFNLLITFHNILCIKVIKTLRRRYRGYRLHMSNIMYDKTAWAETHPGQPWAPVTMMMMMMLKMTSWRWDAGSHCACSRTCRGITDDDTLANPHQVTSKQNNSAILWTWRRDSDKLNCRFLSSYNVNSTSCTDLDWLRLKVSVEDGRPRPSNCIVGHRSYRSVHSRRTRNFEIWRHPGT